MENEQMALSDKMVPMHLDMYKAMLGLNELPIPLLKRYFAIKKLLDRVDGFLSICDLVRIALDCDFNLDTMRFDDPPLATGDAEDKRLQKLADSMAAKNPLLLVGQDSKDEPFLDLQEAAKTEHSGMLSKGTVVEPEEETIPDGFDETPSEEEDGRIAEGTSVIVRLDNEKYERGIVGEFVEATGEYRVQLENGKISSVERNKIQVG